MITTAFDAEVHDRTSFGCGVDSINGFLRHQTTQWIRKGLSSCWVLESGDTKNIIGFYTLSAAALSCEDVEVVGGRHLPKSIQIPALRIGRLGVHLSHQRKGIGEALLIDSLERASMMDAAWAFVIVDALDTHAAAWYKRFGFVAIGHDALRLVMARATVLKALR
ncbi:MAG: GNAT family N-acetyltransferase [Candidatus Kapabacteria bacterium]|nr:GNAT family N-acetyltransferase [Candidatus Kapabacteria bacterium]